VVAQNGAATHLYRNARARPGLRVRLHGPRDNPQAVGAQLRLLFGSKAGPLHEVHAGSGYWSQDSAVPVLATPSAPSQLWVRWPGGKTNSVAVPADAHEIMVSSDGGVQTTR
jgi:enediyne biosynthesis protein E4